MCSDWESRASDLQDGLEGPEQLQVLRVEAPGPWGPPWSNIQGSGSLQAEAQWSRPQGPMALCLPAPTWTSQGTFQAAIISGSSTN